MGCFGRMLAGVGLLIVLVVAAAWQSGDAGVQVAVQSQDEGEVVERAPIERLGFLHGTWTGTIGESTVEESWSPSRSGNVIGMFRWINPDDSIQVLELMSVNVEGDEVIYRLRHFDRALTPWASEADGPIEMRAGAVTDLSVRWEPTDAASDVASITYRVELRNYQRETESPQMHVEVAFTEETGRAPLRFVMTRSRPY